MTWLSRPLWLIPFPLHVHRILIYRFEVPIAYMHNEVIIFRNKNESRSLAIILGQMDRPCEKFGTNFGEH